MAVTQVVRSEWTKIRSVASTVWTLSLAGVVTIALGVLISLLSKNEFDNLSRRDRLSFDPTFISFAGMTLGQLAMIVFGVLVVSNEYSTGMIRTSLAAVPQRGTFLFGKIAVATALAFAVGLATSFVTFFLGQAMLGPHRAGIDDPGVLRAVFGGGLYMTLIAVFSMGVAAMLRSPMLSLGILMPFFFLISNILGNVGATEKAGRYLPDQAGSRIMQVVTPVDDDTPYGPWGGLAIMALWVAAALLGGYLMLKRRDA
ncbi:putative ABC transporter integral membrane subunit [Streptomyces scabiei 87.22]|uniref:ABC-2 family transporter protein n=4 Tax=Streptomyces TaxID=1883 RepID=A0A100JVF9_STRSC|nr:MULTISPECIES: ABC transporter permease [Streptomyces]MBP5861095.1 ABC transporter permease [Streptomyces sp. LBUM 1484]MBP5869951.1 ABC transporter permease [Streptomyces sp. LBUM 1485]MBP5928622.1 ABC transporter permease [Streptomyces sp. LBUM 1479]MBP5878485.1 ABC transporter permease [Streptomyces sp. LBUM 1477]MBP5886327.1 ABC transporter permease [Streptomyces sp. LBUM 1487]